MDTLELHERAARATGSVISELTDDQLTAATPCTEWTAREVIDHMIGNVNGLPERLGVPGMTTPEFGSDPRTAFGPALAFGRDVFRAAEPGRVLRLGPLGEVPAEMLLRISFVDVLVHGWDLAVAVGRPFEVDQELAEAAFAMVSTLPDSPEARGPGKPFAPSVPVPADAPLTDRLLGRTGRDPGWTPA